MWGVALVLVVVSLICAEGFWRWNGYDQTVIDDSALWCEVRGRIESAPSNSLALIGHSRIRQGFANQAFQEEVPGVPAYQLAIFNSNPIITLRDLAENTEFNGIVLCSMLSHCVLPERWMNDEITQNSKHVVHVYHRDWNLAKKLDRRVRTSAQLTLSMFHPDLSIQTALPDIVRNQWPIQWIWTDPDRMQRVEYEKVDLKAYRKSRLEDIGRLIEEASELSSYKNWPQSAQLGPINEWVRLIQDRGGQVVFFRPVTSGPYGEALDKAFPREKFWDHIVNNTPAKSIHFKDVPEMARMECAEGSHLFEKHTEEFTKVLAREIKKLGDQYLVQR